MEFVISPTLCQLRYSFQTWILQFHLWEARDSNPLTARPIRQFVIRLDLQSSAVSFPNFKELISGSGGIRTHLLINHYTDLSRERFYGPLVLHSQLYFNELHFVVPVGLEPTITQLKRLVLFHSATRPSLCSHPDSNRNPWIKSPVD